MSLSSSVYRFGTMTRGESEVATVGNKEIREGVRVKTI